MNFGFLTIAFGQHKYTQQAETLARSLHRNMPGYKIALVTDRNKPNALFDTVITVDDIGRGGVVFKLDMDIHTPFSETMFVDSDCVVIRPFEAELAAIRQFDMSPIVGRYLVEGDTDSYIEDVGHALRGVGGRSFPKFNGGVYFFRKVSDENEVFARARDIRDRAKELGLKDFDKAGPNDETLIGLALASLGRDKLYFDGGRLMRTPFNTTGRIVADPLGQKCSFVKEGKLVEPAIIHYAGDWILHPTYRIAEIALRTGKRVPRSKQVAIRSRRALQTLAAKVRDKLGHILRELT